MQDHGMSERSVVVFEQAREATQRFEYFVLSVSLALCAFVGQTLKPQKLGLTPQTLEIISVLLLVASIIVGFKRLDQMVRVSKLNQRLLDVNEKRRKAVNALDGPPIREAETGTPFTPDELIAMLPGFNSQIVRTQEEMDAVVKSQVILFRWRNRLLVSGFLSLVAAKILAPYFSS